MSEYIISKHGIADHHPMNIYLLQYIMRKERDVHATDRCMSGLGQLIHLPRESTF